MNSSLTDRCLLKELLLSIDDYLPNFNKKISGLLNGLPKKEKDRVSMMTDKELIEYIKTIASDYHSLLWDNVNKQIFFFSENV